MADKISIEGIDGIQFTDIRVVQKYKTPQNPLEDGTPIIDHKVRLPKEITVTCLVKKGEQASATLSKIAELRTSSLSKKYTITDKVGESHKDMVLVNYGHNENSTDKFDNYFFDLVFNEVITSKKKGAVKFSPSDTDNSTIIVQ